MGTGGEARPERDADHSPPSSAEVKNKYDIYFLSPWRLHGVAGQLLFINIAVIIIVIITLLLLMLYSPA
jgi:hypothetical protein